MAKDHWQRTSIGWTGDLETAADLAALMDMDHALAESADDARLYFEGSPRKVKITVSIDIEDDISDERR